MNGWLVPLRADGGSYSEHLPVRPTRAVVEAGAQCAPETGQSRLQVVRATLVYRLVYDRAERVENILDRGINWAEIEANVKAAGRALTIERKRLAYLTGEGVADRGGETMNRPGFSGGCFIRVMRP
jgi:hypothetical protein